MSGDHLGSIQGRERPSGPRSRLFTVRLWTEQVVGGIEYRGCVRDVVSGAFLGFRDWSDLTGFMAERLDECAELADMEGERA